jgi:3',5'-cyclic AMP phosphodiesterase CpdA
MRIVHISDLHFRESLDEATVTDAAKAIEAHKPDLVICTGDVVTRGTQPEMITAYIRAQRFANQLGAAMISVPGNHDMYDKDYNRIDLFTTLWEKQDQWLYQNKALLVVGLNSAVQNDDGDTKSIPDARARAAFAEVASHLKRGDVTAEAVKFLLDATTLATLDEVRILCLHHHLLPIWNPIFHTAYTYDMVANAGEILEILTKNRFDLVLNGHKHTVKLNVLNGVIHLTGGSLFDRMPEGGENTFNIIDIGETIHIKVVNLQGVEKTLLCVPNPKFVASPMDVF